MSLQSINTLRGLSIDQIQAAKSGHPGLPLGMAPAMDTLYRQFLVSDPADPAWFDRDRFVMSCGHGSALVYGVLHLAGYDVTEHDLRAFRQWGSRTPGHPEHGITPGVDATTGPLGQGIANAVGMAIAEQMLSARYNSAAGALVDHRTYVFVSDGDLMEGVGMEAMALAGRLQLGKLIAVYDDNDVVIDGRASVSLDPDGTCAALGALGWEVRGPVHGNDVEHLSRELSAARDSERPTLIRLKSVIGYGSRLADTSSIHAGVLPGDEVTHIKETLSLDPAATFAVAPEVRQEWSVFASRGADARDAWLATLESVRERDPRLAEEFERVISGEILPPEVALAGLEGPREAEATRASSGRVLQTFAAADPIYVGGSADLLDATSARIDRSEPFGPQNRAGRQVAYGVREHVMGAIANGMALHGGVRPMCSTFMMFGTSYAGNSVRMAALQELPVIWILTHDSILIGEDGPTHQPIESLAQLRAIPNLLLLRPADFAETEAAWKLALANAHGPSVLALSRLAVPQLDHSLQVGTPDRGGYALVPGEAGRPLDVCLVSTGSEVSLCVAAASLLSERGLNARVVSLPAARVFEAASPEYREEILPAGVRRLVVETSHPSGLWQFAGPNGGVFGVDTFGASAPTERILEEYGFVPEVVADRAERLAGTE